MKRILFITAAIAVSGIAIVAFKPVQKSTEKSVVINGADAQTPTKWVTDKAHTNVLFSVSHLVVSDVEGSFKSFDGSLEAAKADFSDAKILFSVDVSSVNTDLSLIHICMYNTSRQPFL